MNRQVIPSMILSVLIVCFFSVLLYEREKPPGTAANVRADFEAASRHSPPSPCCPGLGPFHCPCPVSRIGG